MANEKAAKAPNYSEEQTKYVLDQYAAGVSPESIGLALGKATRSVIAKLSRAGVYKKQEYKTKSGEAPTSKEELVEKIAQAMGISSEKLGGLEKANKSTIQLVLANASTPVDTDEVAASKKDLIEQIAQWLNVKVEDVGDLMKVSKPTLVTVLHAVTEAIDVAAGYADGYADDFDNTEENGEPSNEVTE